MRLAADHGGGLRRGRGRRRAPRVAAPAGLAEALLCGVTTVADHHLTWPAGGDTSGSLGRSRRRPSARRAPGVRARVARDDPRRRPHRPTHGRGAGARLAGRGPTDGAGRRRAGRRAQRRAETFRLLGEVAARARPPPAHAGQRAGRRAVAAERYGRRPLDLLDEWGWLDPDVTLAHLCGVPRRRSRGSPRPGSAPPTRPAATCRWAGARARGRAADAGVAVGLGTSGGGSNDAGHLLADARLAMQVAPLVGRPLTAGRRWRSRPPARPTASVAPSSATWNRGGRRPVRASTCRASPTPGWPIRWRDCSGLRPGRRPRDVLVGGRVWCATVGSSAADERESGGRACAAAGGVADARPCRGPEPSGRDAAPRSARQGQRSEHQTRPGGRGRRRSSSWSRRPGRRGSGPSPGARSRPPAPVSRRCRRCPSRQDDTTRAPCSSTTSRMLRSSGTSTVTPVSASSTSNGLLPHRRSELDRPRSAPGAAGRVGRSPQAVLQGADQSRRSAGVDVGRLRQGGDRARRRPAGSPPRSRAARTRSPQCRRTRSSAKAIRLRRPAGVGPLKSRPARWGGPLRSAGSG